MTLSRSSNNRIGNVIIDGWSARLVTIAALCLLLQLTRTAAAFTLKTNTTTAAANSREHKALDNNSTQLRQFTVYRLKPENDQQVLLLQNLYLNDTKLDFWREPTVKGEQVHVMVSDRLRQPFLDTLADYNISAAVMIEDVEKKTIKMRDAAKKIRRNDWLHADVYRRVNFNLAQYHSFNDIIDYLNSLATAYPDRVEVKPIGTTHEGRQIPMIKIGRSTGYQKPAIWVDGGIHAREWVSPAAVLYMIDQLVVHSDSDSLLRQLVDKLDWYMVPLLNPDGYEFSRSSTHPEIRLWRKNRSPMVCHMTRPGRFSSSHRRCCQGVDLNRNYDWQFGTEGTSINPCSEIYQGSFAFSEPETQAVRDFITEHRDQVKAFLTMHSYSQILMYPFGHRVRTYTADMDDLKETAVRAADALRSMYGTAYKVGTGADTLYPASGGAEDWAKGRMGIKYSYLFELRPEEQVWDGFLLAENQIMPTSRETFEAVKVIAIYTLNHFGTKTTTSNFVQRPAHASAIKTAVAAACVDKEPLCSYWAQQGYCTNWPIMRQRCARSCRFCTQATSSSSVTS